MSACVPCLGGWHEDCPGCACGCSQVGGIVVICAYCEDGRHERCSQAENLWAGPGSPFEPFQCSCQCPPVILEVERRG